MRRNELSEKRPVVTARKPAIHLSRGSFASDARVPKKNPRETCGWKWGVFILLFLVAISGYMRFSDFKERLVFGFDQGRDALIVGEAIRSGVSYLPLLGPRVAPTGHEHGFHFRLGPAYYSFQYIAGKIFHTDEPWVFAIPDAIFSAASVVLLFLLLRFAYSWDVSLIATALYATSFLVIQYSRFAWNPNSVAFFVMLAVYAMVRAADRGGGWRIFWISIWALSASIASQLHLTGALTVLGASLIFCFFFTRRSGTIPERLCKVRRYFLFAVLLFLIPYIPVIVSETIMLGANTKAAMSFFRGQSHFDTPFLLFGRAFKETFENYGLILTTFGYDQMDRPNMGHTVLGAVTVLFFVVFAGIGLRAPDARRRLLCLAVLSWATAHFIAIIPIALELETRYFTAVFPLPFIAIAIFLGWLREHANSKIFIFATVAIFVPILSMNVYEYYSWTQSDGKLPSKSLILRRDNGVVLADLDSATRFLCERSSSSGQVFFFPDGLSLYQILYLSRSCPKPPVPVRGFSNNTAAEWYLISATRSSTSSLEGVNIGLAKTEKAMSSGNVTVWRAYPNRSEVDGRKPMPLPDSTLLETPRSDRRYWGDAFERDFFRHVDSGLTIAE